MPFTQFKASYQPANLTEAFNLAWPQIMLAHRAATNDQLTRLRQQLAIFIVACARGEFEPEKLRATALRACDGKWAENAMLILWIFIARQVRLKARMS